MLVTIKSNQALLNAPFGSILLTFKDGELIRCELSEAAVEEDLGSFADHKAVQALNSYLEGNIHAGDTVTYGQIADNLGSSPRAVGSACGDNPLPIFVGCHRVVGKSNLGGFAHSAANVSIKCWLLKHEQQNM